MPPPNNTEGQLYEYIIFPTTDLASCKMYLLNRASREQRVDPPISPFTIWRNFPPSTFHLNPRTDRGWRPILAQ
eukprot:scaffold7872_cov158-Amphora_coffeaeformis.AAC.4